MKIAILDDYQDCVRRLDCFKLLEGHDVKVFTNSARGIGQLAVRLAPFEVLVLNRERTALPRILLNKLPNLKMISQTGKVSGHIDLEAAAVRGISITEGMGDPTAPAELAWALIMAATRKLPQYLANLKDGLWQTVSTSPEYNTLGTVLKDKTLGIWGYGRIGRLVAGYGRAFGMKVMIWGSDTSRAAAVNDGHHAAETKDVFFSESDVISLHLRLNSNTRQIVVQADLDRMKSTALFVNTSRAELVETGALERALRQGRPGYAALDVFETEPLPLDSPLLRMPNVLASPHLGYVEQNSYELYFRSAFQNVLDFAAGSLKHESTPIP